MLLFFMVPGIVSAQSFTISQKKFFTDERIFEMNLVADFKKLIQGNLKKDFESIYHPAPITCLFPDSIKVTEEIEIRPRGKYRREECIMPPLLLNVKASKSAALKKKNRTAKIGLALRPQRVRRAIDTERMAGIKNI